MLGCFTACLAWFTACLAWFTACLAWFTACLAWFTACLAWFTACLAWFTACLAGSLLAWLVHCLLGWFTACVAGSLLAWLAHCLLGLDTSVSSFLSFSHEKATDALFFRTNTNSLGSCLCFRVSRLTFVSDKLLDSTSWRSEKFLKRESIMSTFFSSVFF